MFTIAAFSELVDLSTESEKLTAVTDEHIKTSGDVVVVPELNKLLGFLGIGEDIYDVQIASPSLRRMALLDIAPVENAALPVFPPEPIIKGKSLITLDEDEFLTVYAGNSNIANKQESAIIFLSDDMVAPLEGPIFTIKATGTAPATAYAWDSGALTLAQELPVGDYKLVGARCEQDHTIAFRFIFIGGIWRPGGIAVASIDAKDPKFFRYGQLGIWGTFAHNRVPSVEFFGDGTGGTANVYLDLMKV